MVNKRVRNAVLGCNLKNDRMISVCFQVKPFNITVIQVYAPTSNAEEAEVEWFCEDLLEPSRTSTLKRCLFHYRGLGWKSRKSRDTWSNRQIWPWSTIWSRAKANRVLPRRCTGHTPSSNNTRDESTHGHHQLVKTKIGLITFFVSEDGDTLYSQQKQCQDLAVAHIMNSLMPNQT